MTWILFELQCSNGAHVVGVMCTQGDSGGPLACKDQQDNWTLIGVNSFVYDKCEKAVVARVSAYIDWIMQTIASNS